MTDSPGTGGAGPAGYGPGMPPYAAPTPPQPTSPAPDSVRRAVMLMYTRAVIGVVSIALLAATTSELRRVLERNRPNLDQTQIDTLLHVTVAIGVVFGLILIGLYVWLATQVRRGKNWARITTWVFASLGVLGGLLTLARPTTAASRIGSLVAGALDAAIIILLAQSSSNSFFRPPVAYPPYQPPPGSPHA